MGHREFSLLISYINNLLHNVCSECFFLDKQACYNLGDPMESAICEEVVHMSLTYLSSQDSRMDYKRDGL